MAKLKITQIKSGSGAPQKHKDTLRALGLRHQRSVIQQDNAAIRGMIFKIRHLVQVTEFDEQVDNG